MLSDTDLSIIKYLGSDPRCSTSRMAQDLKLPESTVRHRLNRILENGLIEFAAIVNPLQFGFNTWAIIEIQARLSRIEPICKSLTALPQVYFVGMTTGGYDIMIGAVFRSNDELTDFITGPVAKIPGIIRTSTANVLKVFKRTSSFGLLRAPPPFEPPVSGERPKKSRRRGRRSGKRAPA